MKRIGIGLSDFKHLIEEDFYYFDKTKFIDEVIKDGAQVKLFTRPRRFGKTLNMSMLKYFFDVKNGTKAMTEINLISCNSATCEVFALKS